jgi:ATP/maltotriose-dependent transcriptional regulator MalT
MNVKNNSARYLRPDVGAPAREPTAVLADLDRLAAEALALLAKVAVVRVGSHEPGALRHPLQRPAEPLTDREMMVLRYLPSQLSNIEIAQVLYLSVNTVKTHLRNIYRKLDVERRRDAVVRAREMDLLQHRVDD